MSNVDGAHIADTLKGLDAATTLFIIASKTFTTVETMTNAETARKWVRQGAGRRTPSRHHFAAVSTALDKVAAFGIAPDRVFGFWDWVGGRYSLWSAIGLPIMIAVGPANFRAFLAGAHEMDRHFADAEPLANLPFILGLVGFWHRVVCGYPARAVIPYDQRLSRLPAYLQQLDMESNGKSVTIDGARAGDADRAAGLGRARHQRPARLLPAAAPGHRRHPGRVHRRGQRPRARASAIITTCCWPTAWPSRRR